MKLRHVRSIAVFAVVLVALTGARRGGDGGGCDDHSSSSGSSSSGGSYTSGGSGSDYDDDNNLTSGGSSSTGTTTGGGRRDGAVNDIRITDCVIDAQSETLAEIKWKYTVTNPDADAARYSGEFTFKDDAGAVVGERMFFTEEVAANGGTFTGETTALISESDVTSGDLASLQGRCYVEEADRTPAL